MLNINMNSNRYIIFLACLLILRLFFPFQAATGSDFMEGHFESLQKRLVNDGFDKNMIKKLYTAPQVAFDTQNASLYFMHNEAVLNYGQFTTSESIQKARKYMGDHKAELAYATRKYGVDKEIITAIILVESRLGTYPGKRSVLNMLSTIASLSDPGPQDMLWSKIPKSNRLTRKEFEKKAKKKSIWAYSELKAFIKYTARENIDPLKV